MKRVVVTGMAGISPIGQDWQTVEANLRALNSGVAYMSEWEKYPELLTKLGAPVKDFELPKHYNRKKTLSMGRIAKMATRATELALELYGPHPRCLWCAGAWISIEMMRHNWYAPTINLNQVDENCAELDYITGNGKEMENEIVMSNNFAFGGINTSLIFKRWPD